MKLGKPNFRPNLASFSQKNCTRTLPKSDDILTYAKTLKRLTIGPREKLQTKRKSSKQENGKNRQRYAGYFIGASFCGS